MSIRVARKDKTRYWKVLDERGRACHGGAFQYDLPRWSPTRGWIPGKWTPLIKNVVPCRSGYHVCEDAHLLGWLGPRIYACEVRGTVINHGDKTVAGQIRLTCPTPWDKVSARLFAVECASEVLPLYEAKHPGDSRPSDALETAFLFALGEATNGELVDAGAAVWTATGAADGYAEWAAVRAAVGAAEWGAAAWAAAREAAGYAVAASMRNAAGAVAKAAAGYAARDAQTRRLLWWLGADVAHGGA